MVSRAWVILWVCAVIGLRVGAATLTWDPGDPNNGGTIDPASGTWDTSLAIWNNGTADVAWANSPANAAVFGGSDGAYTVNVGARCRRRR